MTQLIQLHTSPFNQFHFGKTGLDDTARHLHSDTLFSALVITWDKLFPGTTDSFVAQWEEGKLKVSSGFPMIEYWEKGKKSPEQVFFLPKPVFYQYSSRSKALKEVK
jgi:CRISPR/Cas system CSM-associated protein Csm4 (group 5 of RAMP superfamily)